MVVLSKFYSKFSGYLFPMSNAESAEWHSEHGVLFKILYMVPIFFNFRMRIYAGFTLSEVVFNIGHLGILKLNPPIRFHVLWLVLEHILLRQNQDLARDLPSLLSSGVKEKR